ncbi:MAG TPA: Crp/Fnr family transcriptional regulator [Pseudolabrys sp.]|nr:Crp/Fnr family transcriptional regulator [Pseudolabrys sp.]
MPTFDKSSATRPDASALLRAHPVFGELSSAQLDRLCSYARGRTVARGATIFNKGDVGDQLYAIRSGMVKISSVLSDGRQTIFNLLSDGEIFGEIALLDGQARTADAVAMSKCDLIVIERRDFLQFLRDEPKAALRLIEFLCARLRVATDHFEEQVALGIPGRLARSLLRLSRSSRAGARLRKIAATQQELAEIVGTSRETINKQLRAWEAQGWVALERGGLALNDVQALTDVAMSMVSAETPFARSMSRRRTKGQPA